MSAEGVRVGFVGCGVHAAGVLLPAVREAGMELAAICDLDMRRAQRTAARFGAFRVYQDLCGMMDEMDLDAVLACGPPELHAEAALAALERGLPVWTETPPAPTVAEAERLAELARARDLTAQVGLMLRFAPSYQRLRELTGGNDSGEAAAFEITYWPPRLPGHDDPLRFDALHALDLARWLLGEMCELAVIGAAERGLAVSLRAESGAVGTLNFMSDAPHPRERVTVTDGQMVATVEDRLSLTTRRAGSAEMMVWHADLLGTGHESGSAQLRGYLPELTCFARTVAEEGKPLATIEDAVASMRLVECVAEAVGEV